MRQLQSPKPRRGFTAVELLIVIGIIVLLASILIPVISKVQKSAKTAATQAEMSQLQAAINGYYGDFHSYPGPLSNAQIYAVGGGAAPAIVDQSGAALVDANRITGTENLVLGLMGGLYVQAADPVGTVRFNPQFVGDGPRGLNLLQPKKYQSYLATQGILNPAFLSAGTFSTWQTGGRFTDDVSSGNDSQIPEIVDSYPSPMPVLYLRANRGAAGVVTKGVTNPPTAQYDITQIIAYTGSFNNTGPQPANAGTEDTTVGTGIPMGKSIGAGKDLDQWWFGASGSKTKSQVTNLFHGLRLVTPAAVLKPVGDSNYYLPFDAYPYFMDPSSSAANPQARKKDEYILISAGPDRVYGTPDDITNFGQVTP